MGHVILLVTRINLKKRFYFHWKKSSENLADYFTKHFPATCHKNVRSKYVTDF